MKDGYVVIEQTNEFIKLGYSFLKAKGFINDCGEYIPISMGDICVYLHVKQKVEYFAIEKKGEYFATQEMIARDIGLSLSSVKKSLKKFIDNGIIVCYKKKWRNYENWRYVNVKELLLYGEIPSQKGSNGRVQSVQYEDSRDEQRGHVVTPLDEIDPPF